MKPSTITSRLRWNSVHNFKNAKKRNKILKTLHELFAEHSTISAKKRSGTRSRSMSPKILELAQVLADIRRAELSVDLLHATGARVDVLEAILNNHKECYMQKVRALSADELAEFFALIS